MTGTNETDERLRALLREDADRVRPSAVPPPGLRSRAMRRAAFTAVVGAVVVALVAGATVVGVRAIGRGPAPQPAAVPGCSSWSVVTAPSHVDSGRDTYLNSVAATSPADALAIGTSREPGEGGLEVLELQRWDGVDWSELTAPDVGATGDELSLFSVSAAGPGDAWAVGFTNTEHGGIPLALHWDGQQWLPVAVPPSEEPENHLFGVAALAPDDVWAVGGWARPGQLQGGSLVAHWDGIRWSTTALPTTLRQGHESGGPYDTLNAVAGASGADLWAVGGQYNVPQTFQRTLIEHWDGHAWTRTESPNVEPQPAAGEVDDGLQAVAAISPDDAWAVGSYEELGLRRDAPITARPLALHWDGSAWQVVPVPVVDHGGLTGVAALAPDDVWAVGSSYDEPGAPGRPLLVHWDGTEWSETTPPISTTGGLQAVTAIPGGGLWAVGYLGPGSPARSLVLRCS
ncbi:MAG: hypothetical protein ACJ77A_11510 [Actinomycetota bacterium]